jgi:hypothetical protein
MRLGAFRGSCFLFCAGFVTNEPVPLKLPLSFVEGVTCVCFNVGYFSSIDLLSCNLAGEVSAVIPPLVSSPPKFINGCCCSPAIYLPRTASLLGGGLANTSAIIILLFSSSPPTFPPCRHLKQPHIPWQLKHCQFLLASTFTCCPYNKKTDYPRILPKAVPAEPLLTGHLLADYEKFLVGLMQEWQSVTNSYFSSFYLWVLHGRHGQVFLQTAQDYRRELGLGSRMQSRQWKELHWQVVPRPGGNGC